MNEKERFLRSFEDLSSDLDLHHFDITGAPISLGEWAWRFEDKGYQVIVQTKKRGIFVSTVWLGMDHGWGRGAPVIFETMIFGLDSEEYEYQDRYVSLEDALAGHKRACKYAFGLRVRLREALWRWTPEIPLPPIWHWKPPETYAKPWDRT